MSHACQELIRENELLQKVHSECEKAHHDLWCEMQNVKTLLRDARFHLGQAYGAFTQNWAIDFGALQDMQARIDAALGEK